ncbi:MAG: nucleotidyltransferase family protein [Mucinivorans sp.]
MNREAELLFELLRAALCNRAVDDSLFADLSSAQWRAIHSLAVSNAVVCLTFGVVATLPAVSRPERTLFMQWLALSEQKKEHNRLLGQVLDHVNDLYHQAGIEFVLLKGLGVAQWYPDPLLRDGGDIDLMITKGYREANKVLLDNGATLDEENIKHSSFRFRGVSVENHHNLAIAASQSDVLGSLLTSEQYSVFEDSSVKVPSPTFNSIYLISHMAMHFFVNGIGLRHLCDIYLLLAHKHEEIDGELMISGLSKVGCVGFYRRILGILVQYFDLPAQFSPLAPLNDRTTKLLLDDILRGGNFGHSTMAKRTKSNMFNKYLTMRAMVCRSWRFRRMGSAIFLHQISDLLAFNFQRLFRRSAKG